MAPLMVWKVCLQTVIAAVIVAVLAFAWQTVRPASLQAGGRAGIGKDHDHDD